MPINYEDTVETRSMRAEMDTLNAFLNSQQIELEGIPQPPFCLTRRFLLRAPSDPQSFDLHGRLYGGFWEYLPKTRRNGLTINGEPLADLDFVSMFPRLAYARVNAEPPQGDLYAIPGLEEHRAAVKIGFSALLSGASEMRRLPRELAETLPDGWTARLFQEAVSAKHPALMPLFGRDIALDLMFTESRILVATLRRLMAQGISALPMHDGIMVPHSKGGEAEEAMRQCAALVIGTELPVSSK